DRSSREAGGVPRFHAVCAAPGASGRSGCDQRIDALPRERENLKGTRERRERRGDWPRWARTSLADRETEGGGRLQIPAAGWTAGRWSQAARSLERWTCAASASSRSV